jgi:hypothetical protein
MTVGSDTRVRPVGRVCVAADSPDGHLPEIVVTSLADLL